MSNLIVKEVEFNGANLMAAQEINNKKVYVGVRWVCNGIGLTEGQARNERRRIQNDVVLKQGEVILTLPTNQGIQNVLCIDLDFLPLWLAKISITPTMRNNNPDLVDKLVDYQLKAKNVLAEAFLDKETGLVQSYLSMSEEDRAIAYFEQRKANKELWTSNQIMLPKAEAYDRFMSADGGQPIANVAKALKIGEGRNALFSYLRKKKILIDNGMYHNAPYQKFIDAGYFIVRYSSIARTNGTMPIIQTLVTPKGIEFIDKMIKEDPIENYQ